MEGTASTGVYPLHRTKTIHLVRHAQGIHNVAGDKDDSAYLSEEFFDADLTLLGWEQAGNLKKHVKSSGLDKKIELVITSPLLRTMQTAVGVFGGEELRVFGGEEFNSDGVKAPLLMINNAFNCEQPAISTLNAPVVENYRERAPPFLVVENCRERLGVHPCDKRRTVTELHAAFPAIDFSLIENEEDVLWKPDVREKDEELAARGANVINWLWTRKEKEIAIVSHGGFLCNTLSNFGQDCHLSIQEEIYNNFANCELRSIVLVDRSMMGMEGSTYNYPGNIPS
ncbi:hypothetical protein LUZ60_016072 [Juncus effusus]|nr:hypothetical protein LUZ60_016072 [Juncus effusus]